MSQHWPFKKIGEVMEVARGGSPRPIKKYLTSSPDGLNWIKIGDASSSNKYIFETKEKIKKEGLHKTRLVNEGDFLLSNSMSFGRPYIMRTSGCIHDGWLVLKDKGEVEMDKEFLYHILCSPNIFKQFDQLAAGSTVRNLNIGLVSSVKIPVPPLPEQKQIVSILDRAFAAIDQAKANVERNLENAKELFQSKLNEVFSERGEGWEERRLGELGTLTSSKRIFKKEYVTDGIPFYRSKEIKELAHGKEISLELFITKERYEEIKSKFGVPKAGDILLTAVGTIGEIYVVKEGDLFYFKDGNIMWLKDFEELNPYYLKYALTAYVEQLKSLSRGSAYNALTIQKLKAYSISVPPNSKQSEIVDQLDELRERSYDMEELYSQKLSALEELKKSLLQKAFAGELTQKQ